MEFRLQGKATNHEQLGIVSDDPEDIKLAEQAEFFLKLKEKRNLVKAIKTNWDQPSFLSWLTATSSVYGQCTKNPKLSQNSFLFI